MNRIIHCDVDNEFIRGAGGVIGAAGSHDDVELELAFSPMWAGTSRKIVWFDALNEQTVVTALTTDLLVPGEDNLYRVPVPAEAKAVEGDMKITIRGANTADGKETRAVVAATACFKVLPAIWDPLAVESGEPSASVSDQLQQEIEDIKGDIADAAKAAEALAETQQAAQAAAESAETARQYAGKPPVIENGTWHIWNAATHTYTDTLLPARGEPGATGATGGVWCPAVNEDGTLYFSKLDTETPPGPYYIRGPQGAQGVQGPAGPAGSAGPQGPRGIQGVRGDQGETGPAGPTGPQGPAGPAGPQGQKGDDGADGRSFTILSRYGTLLELQDAHPVGQAGDAYAVGTSDDFIVYHWDVEAGAWASLGRLQGPTGAQGPVGPTGPQGPKGDTGAQGPQGIQGEIGPEGPAGAQGAPGTGIASGGTPGQVFVKTGPEDYATGWMTLTPEDVGARPDDWTPTASDVGARPDTWFPTAVEVGAVPVTRTINGKPLTQDVTLTLEDLGGVAQAFYAGTSAPESTKLLWVDTTASTGGLKYYNGTAWVPVPVIWG